jgi:hypothetical protein
MYLISLLLFTKKASYTVDAIHLKGEQQMRKRKQGNNAEHDPFRVVTSATQAIVERYREALAQLEETPIPPELKGNVESELAKLLEREIHALCQGGCGTSSEHEDVSSQLHLGYTDAVERAAVSPLVEGEEKEGGQ